MAVLATAGPAVAAHASTPAITLTRTSWDVIGIKHNAKATDPWQATTPRTYPVSRRVCNTSAVAAADLTATLTLGAGDATHIRLAPGTPSTLALGTLAAGACREATFAVVIGEGHSGDPGGLVGRSRGYTLSVSGAATASSTGTLYVEGFHEQNRNKIVSIDSAACGAATAVCTVVAGQTYTITLKAQTASSFEQIQTHLELPLGMLEVLDVQTAYSLPTGATTAGVYGDACGWNHGAPPAQPAAHKSCVGPERIAGGKAGGTVTTTYTVRAAAGLTGTETGTIRGLIYDLSGGSFHYNDDFGGSAGKTLVTTPVVVAKPQVSFTSGPVSVNENATATRRYEFTATHAAGIDGVVTSCGLAGSKAGGELGGAAGDATRTGWLDCVFDDGFAVAGITRTSTVTVTATQGTANSTTISREVTISNVAPSGTLSTPQQPVAAAAPFTLAVTAASDPSAADTTQGFTYRFDCGSGFAAWSTAASHQCSAPNATASLAVAAEVRDKDGGVTALTGSVTVSAPEPAKVAAPGLSPNPLIFASAPLGASSTPGVVTLANSGEAPLGISGAAISGSHGADFTLTPVGQTCGATLAAGASCTYLVVFKPGAAGARAATLTVTTDAGAVTTALSGIGSSGGSGNRAPVITIALTPDPPRTNDTLSAVATVSDPDSDPVAVSYVWRVNGVVMRSIASGAALTDLYDLSQPGRGDVSNLVTVTATATDGSLQASASATVRVANTAPVASSRTALVRANSAGGLIGLPAADADDQTLHYVITVLPSTGTLKVGERTITALDLPYTVTQQVAGVTLHPAAITYVPNPGNARTDSFGFRAVDTDPLTPLTSQDATVTVGIFEDGTPVTGTTDAANGNVVSANPPTLENPVSSSVQTSTSGLFVSITDAAPRDGAQAPPQYSLLGVEQELHIKENDASGADAVAPAAAPFRVTFSLLAGLLPPGATAQNLAVTRNDVSVPNCVDALDRPLLDQPCVESRAQAGDIITITVLTLNASSWNFSVPSAPDTAIVAAYQGATSAGAPNDPGAPLSPTAGTLSGFAFSSDAPSATFQCRLTRAGGNTAHSAWNACASGATSYVITGPQHPDDLYTFEVRATSGGVTDLTPARRDFVVDRSAVSVTVDSGPGNAHPSTSAEFRFSADKPGATFTCMVRLQSAAPGTYTPCTSPHVHSGLTPGKAYEFNVRAVDEAQNSGAGSWLFALKASAVVDPPPATTPPAPPAPEGGVRLPEGGVPGPVAAGPSGNVTRLGGSGRADTAARLALRYFNPGLPVVYMARDDDFPDALTATPLAVRNEAPILLVSTGALPAETADALRRLAPGRIVVLGGRAAVSDAVMAQLGEFTPQVARLAGLDRFATAAAISQQVAPDGGGTVFIATGETFPDALASGAAAGRLGSPVLLVTRHGIPEVTADELRRLRAKRIVVVGGSTTIDPAVVAAIKAITGTTAQRIAGTDRYETAAQVSLAFFPTNAPAAFVATGQQFADALTAGPISGLLGAPVLLVRPDQVPAPVATELGRMRPETLVVLGGRTAVTPDTEAALDAAAYGN